MSGAFWGSNRITSLWPLALTTCPALHLTDWLFLRASAPLWQKLNSVHLCQKIVVGPIRLRSGQAKIVFNIWPQNHEIRVKNSQKFTCFYIN